MRRRLPNNTRENPLGMLLSLVLLIGVAFLLWRGWGLVFASRFGQFDRFNLVLGPAPVRLLSVDIAGKSAVVLDFPDDLYVPVVHGYGQYKMGAVYAAGQLDKRGGETLSATVSEYVGVPVDGYLISKGSFNSVKDVLLNPGTLLRAETNISGLDLGKLALLFAQLRFDKIKEIDLAKLSSPLVLADGSTARSMDSNVLDNNLAGSFEEGRIRAENLRVQIVNSTKVYGLANQAGRKLANIGMSVVSLATSGLPRSSCEVLAGQKNMATLTVRRIVQTFSCKVAPSETDGRADVTVVLGDDYAKLLGKL